MPQAAALVLVQASRQIGAEVLQAPGRRLQQVDQVVPLPLGRRRHARDHQGEEDGVEIPVEVERQAGSVRTYSPARRPSGASRCVRRLRSAGRMRRRSPLPAVATSPEISTSPWRSASRARALAWKASRLPTPHSGPGPMRTTSRPRCASSAAATCRVWLRWSSSPCRSAISTTKRSPVGSGRSRWRISPASRRARQIAFSAREVRRHKRADGQHPCEPADHLPRAPARPLDNPLASNAPHAAGAGQDAPMASKSTRDYCGGRPTCAPDCWCGQTIAGLASGGLLGRGRNRGRRGRPLTRCRRRPCAW